MKNVYDVLLLSGQNPPHLTTKLCTYYNCNEGKMCISIWTKTGRKYIQMKIILLGLEFSLPWLLLLFFNFNNWGILSKACGIHTPQFPPQP